MLYIIIFIRIIIYKYYPPPLLSTQYSHEQVFPNALKSNVLACLKTQVGLKIATVASVPSKMTSLTSVKWDLVLTAKEIRIQKAAEGAKDSAGEGQGPSTFSISMEED